jgi:hypothetical protein
VPYGSGPAVARSSRVSRSPSVVQTPRDPEHLGVAAGEPRTPGTGQPHPPEAIPASPPVTRSRAPPNARASPCRRPAGPDPATSPRSQPCPESLARALTAGFGATVLLLASAAVAYGAAPGRTSGFRRTRRLPRVHGRLRQDGHQPHRVHHLRRRPDRPGLVRHPPTKWCPPLTAGERLTLRDSKIARIEITFDQMPLAKPSAARHPPTKASRPGPGPTVATVTNRHRLRASTSTHSLTSGQPGTLRNPKGMTHRRPAHHTRTPRGCRRRGKAANGDRRDRHSRRRSGPDPRTGERSHHPGKALILVDGRR